MIVSNSTTLDYLEQLINHGFRMSEEVYLNAVKMEKEFERR